MHISILNSRVGGSSRFFHIFLGNKNPHPPPLKLIERHTDDVKLSFNNYYNYAYLNVLNVVQACVEL